MAEYKVKIKIEGYIEADVEAESVEQARRDAIEAFYEADFGELKDADAKIVTIMDENNIWHY